MENPTILCSRITRNPKVMNGRACIRGTRVTVSMILDQISGGYSVQEMLAAFPYLESEDILEALRYVSLLAHESEASLPLRDDRTLTQFLEPASF